MPQANTQDRKLARQLLHQLNADPGILRRARPRRDHDPLRLAPRDLIDGYLVVAMHFDVAAQLTQVLRQVIGKRIVVVQQQDHRVRNAQQLAASQTPSQRCESFYLSSLPASYSTHPPRRSCEVWFRRLVGEIELFGKKYCRKIGTFT